MRRLRLLAIAIVPMIVAPATAHAREGAVPKAKCATDLAVEWFNSEVTAGRKPSIRFEDFSVLPMARRRAVFSAATPEERRKFRDDFLAFSLQHEVLTNAERSLLLRVRSSLPTLEAEAAAGKDALAKHLSRWAYSLYGHERYRRIFVQLGPEEVVIQQASIVPTAWVRKLLGAKSTTADCTCKPNTCGSCSTSMTCSASTCEYRIWGCGFLQYEECSGDCFLDA